jgi:hypothetical protein
VKRAAAAAAAALATISPAVAQDLEPRSFSPVPVGVNFLAVGYGYSYGNVILDPSLPITGGEARLHSAFVAYLREIDLFGLSGKIDAVLPFVVHGKWRGEVSGVRDSTTRTGFGDPAVRLSVNFVGAPAMRLPEFTERKPRTVVGASLQVLAPLGTYEPERLINLGTNRWTFKPRIGVSQPVGRWILEAHATGWFFTNNPDADGATLQQDPMWATDAHVTRLFGRGIWASFDIGYISGGRASKDGVESAARQESARLGATLAIPVTRRHSVKLSYFSGVYAQLGSDFDNFVAAWQYRWGGGL